MTQEIEIQDEKEVFLNKLQYCNYILNHKGILYNNYFINKIIFINDDGVAYTESLSNNVESHIYKDILQMIDEIYDQDGLIKLVLSNKSYNCDDNKNNINNKSNVELNNNYNYNNSIYFLKKREPEIKIKGKYKKKTKRKSKKRSKRKKRYSKSK